MADIVIKKGATHFDDVLTILVSVTSFALAFQSYSGAQVDASLSSDFGFSGLLYNEGVCFKPRPIMECVSQDQRPESLALALRWVPDIGTPHELPRLVVGSIVSSAFVRYFASIENVVKAKFGTNRSRWPSVLDMGRVVRNAFAHGGTVNFDGKSSRPVRWRPRSNLRELIYSRSDQGRTILNNDLSAADVIVMMCDMNAVLK